MSKHNIFRKETQSHPKETHLSSNGDKYSLKQNYFSGY